MLIRLNKMAVSARESQYVWFMKQNGNIILVSALASVLLTMITYPGILYSDSYGRINMANSFSLWLHSMFAGNAELTSAQAWLTVIPSFFIWLSIKLTGSIALYTFCQCMLLYTALLIMGKELAANRKWIYAWILMQPCFAAYGIYYEAGVGCVTAIIAALMIIWKWGVLKSRFDKIISIILLLVSSFIIFGFRANAFTLLPAMIGLVIWKYKDQLKNIAIIILCIFAGFGAVLFFPRAMHVDTMSSYAAGFVWETISVIQGMDEVKQSEYDTYLDDIFGAGTTRKAIDKNAFPDSTAAHINWILGDPFTLQSISEPQYTNEILEKYIYLIQKEPRDFWRTKLLFIRNTLAVRAPLNMWEYDYNRYEWMDEYRFNDSRQRKGFVDYFLSYMEFMKVFRMPWVMFVIAFILLLIWKVRFQSSVKRITYYDAMFLCAVFYYGAYVVSQQSFEFRYFFPSWVLLYLTIAGLILDMCKTICKGYKPIMCGILIALLISWAGGYFKLTQAGDLLVKNIEEYQLICDGADARVYYGGGNLYFLLDNNADTAYHFFCDYYTSGGEKVDHDFLFADRQVYTSFGKKKIAVETIPMQAFSSVEFGQYYGGTRFWQGQRNISEFIAVPRSIEVLDFSDGNWSHGYGNFGACFLASDVTLENCMLVGKKIVLPDGKTTLITNVETAGGYQRIYTMDDCSVYGERSYLVDE